MATIVAAPAWKDLLAAHRLDSVTGTYASDAGDVIKQAESSEVRRIHLRNERHDRIVFLKKYWIVRPAQLLSGCYRGTLFGRSKVRREYEAAFYPADAEWRKAVLEQSRDFVDRGVAGISSS